ncbi:MAG: tetratricopeptide repeat protein [Thermodesulfobacteriota bacterium]
MKIKNLILLPILLLALCGCAGLSTMLSGAAGEYDAGMTLFNQGKFEEAAGHFSRATELDPEFGEAYLYLGRSYVNLGRWGSALAPLRTAYRLAPGETRKEIGAILLDALISAAIGNIRQGNFADGISQLREGLDLDPASGRLRAEMFTALLGHGGQLLQQGRAGEAIGVYREALGYNSSNSDAYLGLTRAFLQTGDWLKAKDTLTEALRAHPGSSSLNQFLQQMLLAPR